jgi:hypothetical protein
MRQAIQKNWKNLKKIWKKREQHLEKISKN